MDNKEKLQKVKEAYEALREATSELGEGAIEENVAFFGFMLTKTEDGTADCEGCFLGMQSLMKTGLRHLAETDNQVGEALRKAVGPVALNNILKGQ